MLHSMHTTCDEVWLTQITCTLSALEVSQLCSLFACTLLPACLHRHSFAHINKLLFTTPVSCAVPASQGQLALVTGSCSRITPSAKDPHFDTAWANRQASSDTAAFATPPVTWCQHHQELPWVTVRQVLQRRLEGRTATFKMLVRLTR